MSAGFQSSAAQSEPSSNDFASTGTPQHIEGRSDTLEILCGPLINYRRMSGDTTWHGSVLIVTKPSSPKPSLRLECLGAIDGSRNGTGQGGEVAGVKLYEDPVKAFWRFMVDVPIQTFEARWQYSISPAGQANLARSFVVASKTQSFRIMFHSCNGFSVGTDTEAWSGPALWNDVLRKHEQQPFHVMLGGGDQIYNDGVRVDGPLKEWTAITNPRKRRDYLFGEKLRTDCDEYYFNNYVKWYGQEPFKSGNAVIPQVNIWDDHDIIDGFGSYTDHFMRSPVFRGIGGVAHKYYMLFQHHAAPPKSTFTTDAAATMHNDGQTTGADSVQLKNSWVLKDDPVDPSHIVGAKPGPYVEEPSRSIYCQLGARIAFAGIDARTERTRHQVNYPETYNKFFSRIDQELSANSNIKHLILLLGVPIAYPRLQWLENFFTSPVIAPIRFLNKRFGIAGGMFNKFDGQIDLLDDLDDHYTARNHKVERRELLQRLQALAKNHSVRISILGGDVHLAAVGRFFSKPELQIEAENDWRFMPNIISSAITNKPPPNAVANLLAKRNKIHHLDNDTDETLLEIFDHDPGLTPVKVDEHKSHGAGKLLPHKKSADSNHVTMPSRNFAIIAESHDHSSGMHGTNGNTTNGNLAPPPPLSTNGDGASISGSSLAGRVGKHPNSRLALHAGEVDAGTKHAAAGGFTRTGLGGIDGLDVTICVEISNKDREGHTEGYGFSIPALNSKAYVGQGTTW